jgi:hypothetical protein
MEFEERKLTLVEKYQWAVVKSTAKTEIEGGIEIP